MTADLNGRLKRVRAAFGVVEKKVIDPNSLLKQTIDTPTMQGWFLDLDNGKSQEDHENEAHSLIANIASLKDHFKEWCTAKGKSFSGDALINSNLSVAIIHDLWNADKHGKLGKSRSGHYPVLTNVSKYIIGPFTLFGGAETGDNSQSKIVVDGDVNDQNGVRLGQFQQLCNAALLAWEQEMLAAGVQIPP